MTVSSPTLPICSGRLDGIGMPEVFAELLRTSASGTLHVRSGDLYRTARFENGQARFATSSNPNDRLGEHVLRSGRASLQQLEKALAEQHGGKRLGRLMVESGILGEEDLVQVVREQIRTTLIDLLCWEAGHYQFESEAVATPEEIVLEISTEQLIFEGILRNRSVRRVLAGAGPPNALLQLSEGWAGQADRLELSPAALSVLEALREPTDLATLCNEGTVSGFETAQVVWAFRQLGLLSVSSAGQAVGRRHGRLEQLGLAERLIRLERESCTGVLYLNRGSEERSFHFAAGRCVFATSNEPDLGLVHFLFRRGVISLADKSQIARRQLSNKRVGTILRELGVIDDDELSQMVEAQVREIVIDSLLWVDGSCVFVEGPLPNAEEITIEEPVASLIAEGIRRETSWTRLVRGCGGIDNPLQLTAKYLEVLDLIDAGVAEWQVVNALRSPQTPRRVCSLTELDDLRVLQILWTMRLLSAAEDVPFAETNTVERPTLVASTDTTRERPEPEGSVELELEVTGETPINAKISEADIIEGTAAAAAELSLAEIDDWAVEDEAVLADEEEIDVSPVVERAIDRFNAMHRVVYRVLRSEIGAGAANFVRSCAVEVARQAPDLVAGVPLHADGSWDKNRLKRAVRDQGIDEPWDVFRLMLDREFLSLEPHLGGTRAGQLRDQILEIGSE